MMGILELYNSKFATMAGLIMIVIMFVIARVINPYCKTEKEKQHPCNRKGNSTFIANRKKSNLGRVVLNFENINRKTILTNNPQI